MRSTPTSARPLLFAAALVASLLVAPRPAQAQLTIPLGPVWSGSYGNDACGLPLSRALGPYLLVGVSQWPAMTGLSLTAGLFHNRRFGLDTTVAVPLGNAPLQPFVLANASLRAVLWREGLDEEWTPGHKPPDLALVLGLRAGPSLLLGASDGVFALTVGPTLELLWQRTFVLALRPSIAVRPMPPGETRPVLPLDVFPSIELAGGWSATWSGSTLASDSNQP